VQLAVHVPVQLPQVVVVHAAPQEYPQLLPQVVEQVVEQLVVQTALQLTVVQALAHVVEQPLHLALFALSSITCLTSVR
jgi:hypothetical protein